MRTSVGLVGSNSGGGNNSQRPSSRFRARSPGNGQPAALRQNSGQFGFLSPNRRASGVGSGNPPFPDLAMSGLASGSRGVPPSSSKTKDPRLSVVVRKRPMNRREAQAQQTDVVICRNSAVIVREPKLKVDLTKYVEEHNFLFDHSFDENVSNDQLYDHSVRPVIDAVFAGAKCTCFAYGQTGSGKTFTMMGPHKRQTEGVADVSEKAQGIFLLAARDLFFGLESEEFNHLGIYVSFYEIYCGKLFDLLNNRQLLHARENAKSNVVIVGLQEHRVENVQDLMRVIDLGLACRTTGVTGANVDSSRSHAILQISLQDPHVTDSEGKPKGHGKVSFIDLAGSERGADTMDKNRQTRMDGAEINKSLLALKECIRALGQQQDHTPFRGSKLTQVLKDSFVGSNCRTVMIANVSPCSMAVEHSLNTLRYAYRVKELRSSTGGKGGPGFEEGGQPRLDRREESELFGGGGKSGWLPDQGGRISPPPQSRADSYMSGSKSMMEFGDEDFGCFPSVGLAPGSMSSVVSGPSMRGGGGGGGSGLDWSASGTSPGLGSTSETLVSTPGVNPTSATASSSSATMPIATNVMMGGGAGNYSSSQPSQSGGYVGGGGCGGVGISSVSASTSAPTPAGSMSSSLLQSSSAGGGGGGGVGGGGPGFGQQQQQQQQQQQPVLAAPGAAPAAPGSTSTSSTIAASAATATAAAASSSSSTGAGAGAGSGAAPDTQCRNVQECSQTQLDELARQHDRLIGMILAEEEELITAHRQHIDTMVELIKEEMLHLNNVDRPGSDVDAYVTGLDQILAKKAAYIGSIQKRLDVFKEHLQQEDALSKKFQQLAQNSTTGSSS